MTSPTEKHLEAARAAVRAGKHDAALSGWRAGSFNGLGMIEIYVAQALSNAEREGMRRAAEIARGSSGEFDFQSALGEGRDFDYGFHSGKNHAADSILATIIIDNSNSPDSPLVGAKAGEAGSPSSHPSSPAPYDPWTVKNGFSPDKVG